MLNIGVAERDHRCHAAFSRFRRASAHTRALAAAQAALRGVSPFASNCATCIQAPGSPAATLPLTALDAAAAGVVPLLLARPSWAGDCCRLSLPASPLLQERKGPCVPHKWRRPAGHAGAGLRACQASPAFISGYPSVPHPALAQLPLRPSSSSPPTSSPTQTRAVRAPVLLQYYYLPVVSARSFLWPGLKETRAGARQLCFRRGLGACLA